MKKTICCCLTIGLMFIALQFPTTQARGYGKTNIKAADCVKCGWNGTCRSCKGGGTNNDCMTPDCGVCATTGRCININFENQSNNNFDNLNRPPLENINASFGSEQSWLNINETLLQSQKLIELDPKIIKEIGAKHPRFAATLATLNLYGIQKSVYTYHWTPVEIFAKDIDAFLNRKEHPEYFEKLNQASQQLNKQIQNGDIQEIIYNVSLEDIDQYNQLIKLVVVNPSSTPLKETAYNSLEIELRYKDANIGIGEGGKQLLRTTWRLCASQVSMIRSG